MRTIENGTDLPGVGHYSVSEIALRIKTKSPNATIGRHKRFHEVETREYVQTVPTSYLSNSQPASKLGKIGTEKRWVEHNKALPGVGDYDLLGFKTLSKASESIFRPARAMSAKSSKCYNCGEDAWSQKNDCPMNQNAQTASLGKRLGGPTTVNENTMHAQSRG